MLKNYLTIIQLIVNIQMNNCIKKKYLECNRHFGGQMTDVLENVKIKQNELDKLKIKLEEESKH
jgi:hypothetical protein